MKYCKSIVTNMATAPTFEVLLNKDKENTSVFQVINSSSNNDLLIYNFLGLAESHICGPLLCAVCVEAEETFEHRLCSP